MRSALQQVLHRSNDELEFRTALLNHDERALAGYDLTPREVTAVLSGDESELYRLLGDSKYFHIREQGNYCADEG